MCDCRCTTGRERRREGWTLDQPWGMRRTEKLQRARGHREVHIVARRWWKALGLCWSAGVLFAEQTVGLLPFSGWTWSSDTRPQVLEMVWKIDFRFCGPPIVSAGYCFRQDFMWMNFTLFRGRSINILVSFRNQFPRRSQGLEITSSIPSKSSSLRDPSSK